MKRRAKFELKIRLSWVNIYNSIRISSDEKSNLMTYDREHVAGGNMYKLKVNGLII